MQIPEIVPPITSPESEWIDGRRVRKVSPRRKHARLQTTLAGLLDAWAEPYGEVGTEWRFRVQPPGEARRPLVPDLAFVEHALLRGRSDEEIDLPDFAPTVAIEILPPGDRLRDVASKIDVYLRSGTKLVIVIDPATRTIALHDVAGPKRELTSADALAHPALPAFTLDIGAFFSKALDRPRSR